MKRIKFMAMKNSHNIAIRPGRKLLPIHFKFTLPIAITISVRSSAILHLAGISATVADSILKSVTTAFRLPVRLSRWGYGLMPFTKIFCLHGLISCLEPSISNKLPKIAL